VLSLEDLDIFEKPQRVHETSKPVFDWFLIALACLIPLDVGVRRVQLDWSVIKSWFGFGKKGDSTATMGALLERKKQVQTAVAPQERPKPVNIPSAPVPASVPKPAVPSKAEKPEQAKPDAAQQSTTERLLARKRKRDGDQ
jgi:hypothetical protein